MRPILPLRLILAAGAAALLCGCAGTAGSMAGAALQLAGLKGPDLPDAQKPPRSVAITLHAGANLNADAGGHPLALVTKIYKLRQRAAFQQAPYDGFLNAQREREMLGADLLEVKEVLLVPGQRYEVQEKVSREAYYIGVVALFRAPAPQRWRLAFGAADAEQAGIAIGMNACAMSVGSGSASAGEPLRAPGAPRCD
jgi:type VI secretion system protein VasD